MPGVFVCDVIGNGTSPEDAFRPDLPAGTNYITLMIDPVHSKAIVASNVSAISHPGTFRMFFAATWDALRLAAVTTSPTTPQRNQLDNWLTSNGYIAVPAALTIWKDVIEFAVHQVEPGASVNLAFVGGEET